MDKNGDSGAGSTSGSCAIVRAHYSTLEGVAFAYEGFHIWKNWADYCEVDDPWGMAHYNECGSVMVKSQDRNWRKILEHWETVGVPHENWDAETLKEKMPPFDVSEFWPPSRPEKDENFFDKPDQNLEGAIYCPEAGYMSDPKLSTHNAQVAAEAKGATFRFNAEVKEIRQTDNKVLGITLTDGTAIDAPIVINVAGPHSKIINTMAGVEDKNNIKTRAERHEVCYVPSPAGFNFEKDGAQISDGDNGIYLRPEVGNSILVAAKIPRVMSIFGWMIQITLIETRQTPSGKPKCSAPPAGCPISPFPINTKGLPSCMTSPATGYPYTTRAIWKDSSWPSALRAISTRMRPSPEK